MWDAVEQALDSRARRRSRKGLILGLGAAFALHVGVVLAFALVPEPEEPPPLEYVAVRVVPLAALGQPDAPLRPARRPRTEPPRPEPAPQIETPAETETPETEPPDEPPPPQPEEPSPRGPVLPDPDDERRKPAEPVATPPGGSPGSTAGRPDGSPTGTSPFGATRLEGIDPDFTYDYYLDRMLSLIHANWRRPPTQGEVRAALRFTVRKNGEIADLSLEEESGFSTFDLAALRAVQNASPLPPLPASYRKGELTVTLIVR